VSAIRQVMEKKMASRLSEADLALVTSGEPRWWNAICWERADLVREGLFADSERGVWKLSEKGKKLVG
jgi:restriction endonuclease Mrr